MDRLMEAGKIRYYGVSVERVEEALKAIEYPNVQTVQIIFNCFRQRPADLFFEQAKHKQVGILARVPLASGMLTGKLTRESQFAGRRSSQLQPPRASGSTSARHSRASITRRAWRRWRRSANFCQRA